jgi:hypothetical protein
MNRIYVVIACLCVTAISAFAGVIAMPPPGPARVAKSDVVIVGKVESIEPADVKVGNANYRIAVVQISDGIRGVKDGVKALRVGFIPIEKPKPNIIITGGRPVQLAVGQEGLFLLTKQAQENFYTIGGIVGYYVNSENNPNFAKEVQAAKAAAKLGDNPQAGLKSRDAAERLLAAAVLIEKYRAFKPKAKQEPIDAEESKLILQALAGADWKGQTNFASLQVNPTQLFQRLGVTKEDGFVVAKGGNFQTTIQEWLRANAGKYRIQRYAADGTK